jgi:hypothetical protein
MRHPRTIEALHAFIQVVSETPSCEVDLRLFCRPRGDRTTLCCTFWGAAAGAAGQPAMINLHPQHVAPSGITTAGSPAEVAVLARAIQQLLDDDPWFSTTIGVIAERALTGIPVPPGIATAWDGQEARWSVHLRSAADMVALVKAQQDWLLTEPVMAPESTTPRLQAVLIDDGQWAWVQIELQDAQGVVMERHRPSGDRHHDLLRLVQASIQARHSLTVAHFAAIDSGALAGLATICGGTTVIDVADPAAWEVWLPGSLWRGRRLGLSNRMIPHFRAPLANRPGWLDFTRRRQRWADDEPGDPRVPCLVVRSDAWCLVEDTSFPETDTGPLRLQQIAGSAACRRWASDLRPPALRTDVSLTQDSLVTG